MKKESGELDGYLGRNVRVQGDLVSENTLRFDGVVEGNLISRDELMMGTEGRVNGRVIGQDITIAGTVEGDVLALGKLDLLSSAVIRGEICGAQVTVHEGARIEGRCRLGVFSEIHLLNEKKKYNF